MEIGTQQNSASEGSNPSRALSRVSLSNSRFSQSSWASSDEAPHMSSWSSSPVKSDKWERHGTVWKPSCSARSSGIRT